MKRNSIIQKLGPQRITLHLLEDSIAEDEHNYFHGIQGGAWFGSVRTASEVGIRGHEGAFHVKQYLALFQKDLNSTALEDAQCEVSVVIDVVAPNGIFLIALGHR